MGKRAYAESLYKNLNFYNMDELKPEFLFKPENIKKFNAIINIHMGVRSLLLNNNNIETQDFFNVNKLKNFIVIIGDEIGSGVVPLDKFERRWRDETGLLYQKLTQEADIVDRVWAGLNLRLKYNY